MAEILLIILNLLQFTNSDYFFNTDDSFPSLFFPSQLHFHILSLFFQGFVSIKSELDQRIENYKEINGHIKF